MNSENLHVRMGRREDFRFVTGQGQYTADMVPDGALHAVFVRSAIARGHLRHLSVEMARKAPDVVAVLTADEAAEDGVADMVWTGAPVRDDGVTGVDSPRPLLNGFGDQTFGRTHLHGGGKNAPSGHGRDRAG